jgi:hypothetical protein
MQTFIGKSAPFNAQFNAAQTLLKDYMDSYILTTIIALKPSRSSPSTLMFNSSPPIISLILNYVISDIQ